MSNSNYPNYQFHYEIETRAYFESFEEGFGAFKEVDRNSCSHILWRTAIYSPKLLSNDIILRFSHVKSLDKGNPFDKFYAGLKLKDMAKDLLSLNTNTSYVSSKDMKMNKNENDDESKAIASCLSSANSKNKEMCYMSDNDFSSTSLHIRNNRRSKESMRSTYKNSIIDKINVRPEIDESVENLSTFLQNSKIIEYLIASDFMRDLQSPEDKDKKFDETNCFKLMDNFFLKIGFERFLFYQGQSYLTEYNIFDNNIISFKIMECERLSYRYLAEIEMIAEKENEIIEKARIIDRYIRSKNLVSRVLQIEPHTLLYNSIKTKVEKKNEKS
ncbi:MAG: hypothetical protein GX435_02870 [Exilispira sp.]|nr:hypothetical protein [Exilispira sp.]